MVSREITCQKENGVAVINLSSAPPRNSDELTCLVDALSEMCTGIASDNDIHVVIVTGEEGAFDMGAITGFPTTADEGGMRYRSLAASIAALDCPVIAAANGRVAGPGLELILACDIRIATEDSLYSFPQIMNGNIPGDGGTQRLPRIVGRAKALEMILTGKGIDGREAKRVGLVTSLVSPAELQDRAREMAGKMALQAPLSLRYAKEAVSKGMEMNINQGLRLEADLYFLLHTTRDRREGIEAFRGKRKPEFEGK